MNADEIKSKLVFVDLPEPECCQPILRIDELRLLSDRERRDYCNRVVQRSLYRNRELKPITCPVCFPAACFNRIYAHHEDYFQPLRIAFVCHGCHTELHRKSRAVNE